MVKVLSNNQEYAANCGHSYWISMLISSSLFPGTNSIKKKKKTPERVLGLFIQLKAAQTDVDTCSVHSERLEASFPAFDIL